MKIKIQDLPRDYKISTDEMKRIRGGLLISTALQPSSLTFYYKGETTEEVSLNYEEVNFTYTPQR